jgi:hypothetical protein
MASPAHSPHTLPQALATFGADAAIAFSGAEDVALVEYAHLTGRPYRVFRCGRAPRWGGGLSASGGSAGARAREGARGGARGLGECKSSWLAASAVALREACGPCGPARSGQLLWL